MKNKPEPSSPMTIRRNIPKESRLDRLAKRLVLWHLGRHKNGKLTMTLPGGETKTFGGQQPGCKASLTVHHDSFFRSVLLRGNMGLGEAYADGLWDSDDLQDFFGFFLGNHKVPKGRKIPNPLTGLRQRLLSRGLVRPPVNDPAGAKQNVQAHYDLSNQAFSLFLDPSMTYSCALFKDPNDPQESLEEAQRNKLRQVAKKAGIKPGDQVLEIGCGWGSFSVLAAQELDCTVTALTLSQQQFDYVRQLVERLGLTDKVRPVLGDYREQKGKYNAVVSIEMIEAVGYKYHRDYFQAIDRLLAPGGRAVIQAITLIDQRYDAYRQAHDWVNTYIFPGGLLVSTTRMAEVISRHTGLVISSLEDIGKNYIPTLRAWRARFHENWDKIEELGFDERFKRTFHYYFSICEAPFRFGHTRDLQIVLDRPRYRQPCLENS